MAIYNDAFKMIGKKIGLGVGGGIALETVINAGFTYSTAKDEEEKGHGKVMSWAKAIGSTLLWNEFMIPMMALQLAPVVPLIHQKLQNAVGGVQRKLIPMSPYGRPDSQIAQTSRQRAMQAIQSSRLNARNTLGNEAGIYSPRFR